MSITANTQAILLLTAHFTKVKEESVKPLSPREWGRFALWLKDHSLTPENLLTGHFSDCLRGWSDKAVTTIRIESLLNRGPALALATEKWLRAGLWVMTRSDSDYPKILKQRLGFDSPAVLFGCGNRNLLGTGGLAVVGSRKTSNLDLEYSAKLGELAAENGISIISGGARGVDESAMSGALQAEGMAIGVLADGLLRAATSAKYRPHLMNNNLVLLSAVYPDAGFNAGMAMQRNKYIYCLSDAAFVVHSGIKGGTWHGAHENLKKHWVPLWVKKTLDRQAGNTEIINAGGELVSENILDVDIRSLMKTVSSDEIGNLVLFQAASDTKPIRQLESSRVEKAESRHSTPEAGTPKINEAEGQKDAADIEQMDFNDFFLFKFDQLKSDSPVTLEELVEQFGVTRTQLSSWLKKAVDSGKIEKLRKPVRYQRVKTAQKSFGFEDD